MRRRGGGGVEGAGGGGEEEISQIQMYKCMTSAALLAGPLGLNLCTQRAKMNHTKFAP